MSSKFKSLQKITVSTVVQPDAAANPLQRQLSRSEMNFERTRKYLTEDSQNMLSNRQVRYFAVDKMGLHCFILCSDAVFYANFNADTIHELKMPSAPKATTQKAASKFTCIDMIYASQDVHDMEVFEVVLGR